jgi:hypothetical protein
MYTNQGGRYIYCFHLEREESSNRNTLSLSL